MAAPDVNTHDGRVIISSEEGECDSEYSSPLLANLPCLLCTALLDKTLRELNIFDYAELTADDFAQSLELRIVLVHKYFPCPCNVSSNVLCLLIRSNIYEESGVDFEVHQDPPPANDAEDEQPHTSGGVSERKRHQLQNKDDDVDSDEVAAKRPRIKDK